MSNSIETKQNLHRDLLDRHGATYDADMDEYLLANGLRLRVGVNGGTSTTFHVHRRPLPPGGSAKVLASVERYVRRYVDSPNTPSSEVSLRRALPKATRETSFTVLTCEARRALTAFLRAEGKARAVRTAPAKSATRETRDRIDELMTRHGAYRLSDGPRRNYRVPMPTGGTLQVETHVRGSVTTDLGMERWRCLDALADVADPWLEENVCPAARRWLARCGGWVTHPTGGAYSGTTVLTAEAVDVLAAWLAKEIEWQRVAAERLAAEVSA